MTLKIPDNCKLVTLPPGTIIVMAPAEMRDGKLDPGTVTVLRAPDAGARDIVDDRNSK
jgi:hypothetical protein